MIDDVEREFSARLAASAALCEARLRARLTDLEVSGAAPPRLVAAMRHALLAGGKRFRPFLVIESAALFGIPAEESAEAAVAIECLHTYSLVHDDLPAMDDDVLRRGQPTVHVAFDEATAILAGDALLTAAFEQLSSPSAHPDPAVRSELVGILARAGGAAGMVGGQILDLEAESRPPDETGIRRLQAMKTGALITASCEMGAALARASATERAALAAYGRRLGLAFQVADDLLDVESSTETLGKAAAKDAARGKATLVARLGTDGARRLLDDTVAGCIAALEPFGETARHLREAARFAVRRKN